jgi:hypothetical protein
MFSRHTFQHEGTSYSYGLRTCSYDKHINMILITYNNTSHIISNIKGNVVVTLHTTACCNMSVIDITFTKYQSANITSLGVVQLKHSWSLFHSLKITSHIYTSHWSSSWSREDNSKVLGEPYLTYTI